MNIAVILAAGKGIRIRNADKPKQYLEIGGRPMLCHAVEKFLVCNQIDHIVVAVHKDWIQYTKALFADSQYSHISICEGSDNRQESLYQALIYSQEQLKAPDDAIILSHDAARPFVTQEIIEANIRAMQSAQAVTTAIPVIDTIVQSKTGSVVTATTDRSQMYQIQTPQTFFLAQYIKLYKTLDRKQISRLTDVTGVFHAHGVPVILVQGHRKNIKITTDEDLQYADYLLAHLV